MTLAILKILQLTRLEDFVAEFRNDVRDEIRIGVGEEGHRRDE